MLGAAEGVVIAAAGTLDGPEDGARGTSGDGSIGGNGFTGTGLPETLTVKVEIVVTVVVPVQ